MLKFIVPQSDVPPGGQGCEVGQICLKLSELVRDCPNLSGVVRTCPELTKPVQSCASLPGVVRACPGLSELVRICPGLSRVVVGASPRSPRVYSASAADMLVGRRSHSCDAMMHRAPPPAHVYVPCMRELHVHVCCFWGGSMICFVFFSWGRRSFLGVLLTVRPGSILSGASHTQREVENALSPSLAWYYWRDSYANR